MLVVASPKFHAHALIVPDPIVDTSVNAMFGQEEVLKLKFAVQVIHEIVTVF